MAFKAHSVRKYVYMAALQQPLSLHFAASARGDLVLWLLRNAALLRRRVQL